MIPGCTIPPPAPPTAGGSGAAMPTEADGGAAGAFAELLTALTTQGQGDALPVSPLGIAAGILPVEAEGAPGEASGKGEAEGEAAPDAELGGQEGNLALLLIALAGAGSPTLQGSQAPAASPAAEGSLTEAAPRLLDILGGPAAAPASVLPIPGQSSADTTAVPAIPAQSDSGNGQFARVQSEALGVVASPDPGMAIATAAVTDNRPGGTPVTGPAPGTTPQSAAEVVPVDIATASSEPEAVGDMLSGLSRADLPRRSEQDTSGAVTSRQSEAKRVGQAGVEGAGRPIQEASGRVAPLPGGEPPTTLSGASTRAAETDDARLVEEWRRESQAATPAPHASSPTSESTMTGGLTFQEGRPVVERQTLDAASNTLAAGVVGRVVKAVRTAATGGGVEVQVQLQPESLGDVRVAIRWEGGLLSAHLEASTLVAREALEGNLQSLRTALQEQGIPIDHLDVGLRMDLHGEAHDREAGRQTTPAAPSSQESFTPEPEEAPAPPRHSGRLDVRI